MQDIDDRVESWEGMSEIARGWLVRELVSDMVQGNKQLERVIASGSEGKLFRRRGRIGYLKIYGTEKLGHAE